MVGSRTHVLELGASWPQGPLQETLRRFGVMWTNGQGTQGTPVIEPGQYHFTFRMRSPDTDAIRFGPVYQDPSYRQYQYLGLSPEWRTYEMTFNVPDLGGNDYMVSAFQNVQYSLGMLGNSVVELDFIEAKACTLNTQYAEDVIAEEHILRYHCPLTAVGGQNAGASFNIPGDPGQCWSDVYGNFYAAGDNYPLDPWESVVLFRMDVTTSDLVFTNGVHTVSGNVTINTHQNIAGSIVVPSGATLTIDGAHIGFVASTPQLTTNLTVQPGGTLVLKNGATLRNWMGCDAPAAMWDGVQAGAMIGQTGHPRIDVLSGSSIMNAHTALFFAQGDPKNPIGTASLGSEPRFTIRDSNFRNNVFDVFISPALAVIGGVSLHRSSIERTNFVTTSVLTDATLKPKDHVHMRYVRNLPIKASVFANTSGLDASTPTRWGNGIVALNSSSPHVTHEGEDRSKFINLHYGIRAESTFSNLSMRVEQTDFIGCAAGLYVAGHRNTRITENTFAVPDLDVRFKGVAATYGSYLVGCSGFELEENIYRGMNGTEHPKVGAVFYQTGEENNEYYRNRFDNFRDVSGASVGTVIMGNNGGTAPESGLHFRCNNYSNDQLNDNDIALTGSTVTIGSEQGVNMNEFTLAGNTFANFAGTDCGGNDERHLFVDLYGSTSLNVFQYWHHAEETAVEFRPHCDSYPIVVNEDPVVDWIKATNYFYVDEACPQSLSSTRTYSDAIEELLEVEAQYKLLKAVYSDWSDGGDTEGLRDYILDQQNNSFAVRNQLMLLAPKVSHANWELAFARTPAMDPWHLAQALVANSPLTLQTMVLLDSSLVNPYYKQLVTEAQTGISMHSIYQGELAHLYGRQARIAYDVVAQALVDSLPGKVDSTLMVLEGMLLQGREQLQVALHLSKSELGQARIALDSMHTKDPEDGYWKVQDLALSLLEEEKSLEEIDAAGIALLEDVVATEKEGLAEALSWLKMLGQEYTELLILPTQSKRGRPHAPSKPEHHWSPLLVYPNPSNGPVNIVYEVPDAVERAELRVMNALGQLVIQKSISSRGILVLELPRTASGLHVAGLFFDGHLMATEKLNIIR